jgi:hypothetical protein
MRRRINLSPVQHFKLQGVLLELLPFKLLLVENPFEIQREIISVVRSFFITLFLHFFPLLSPLKQ